MNIMKNMMLDCAHCAICSLWVDTTLFQDPAVSWHAHRPCLMVFLSSWYVRMAFGASSIILLSDQIPNGDFGVNSNSSIVYVILTVFKFYWVAGAKCISFHGSLVLVRAINSPWTFAVLSVWDVWSCGIAFLVLNIQISGVMWPQHAEHVYLPCLDCNRVQRLGSLFWIPATTPSVL
jgi:hypothetical protein